MKKTLSLLLTLVFISILILTGGAMWVNHTETEIFYTEEVDFGDRGAAQNFSIRSLTTVNGHLHWDTVLTLGENPTWNTDFSFTNRNTWYSNPIEPYLNLYLQSNMGVSSSGGLEIEQYTELDFLAKAIEEVASHTQAGELEHTEILPLAQYLDYFSVGLDSVSWSPSENGEWWYTEWQEADQFFQIPVGEQQVRISVGKGVNGEIYNVSYQIYDAPFLNCITLPSQDGGWYMLYSGEDEEGNSLMGAPKHGLYYLPIIDVEDGVQRIDTEHIKLLYQVEKGRTMFFTDSGRKLLLQSGSGFGDQITVLDVATMQPIQTISLDEKYQQGNEDLYVKNDYFVRICDQTRTEGEKEDLSAQFVQVWELGTDGQFHKTIDCDINETGLETYYWQDVIYNGEKLMLCRYENDYNDPSIQVAVCDPEGLQYAAWWRNSQRDQNVNVENNEPLLAVRN